MFSIFANIVICVMSVTLREGNMTAKNQLIKLAKIQDLEPELYKMPYSGLEWIKEKIDEIIHEENDDQLFSILMRLKSHIMVVEDWVLEQEIKETKKLSTFLPITSYGMNQIGMEIIYA